MKNNKRPLRTFRAIIVVLAAWGFYGTPLGAAHLSQALEVGYLGDLGSSFHFRFDRLSENFPVFVDAGVGFSYQFDSGDATAARAIFINDGTGGNIEKHGENYIASLDVGYPFSENDKFVFEPYGGVRFNHYKAYYAFIGDNEAFTVRSNTWGLALGTRLKIPVSPKHDYFYVNGGAEFYFKAPLLSHGTFFYTPDGDDDRPRNAYTYDDADDAVRQPRFRPILAIGFQFTIR